MVLPLKIGNWNLILVQKNVTYISGFPLNFVLLAILEDQGFYLASLVKKYLKQKIANN